MADITLSYKGSTIAEVSASGTTKLNTKGKFCEDDITLQYVKPSGGGSYIGGTVAWNQLVDKTNFQANGYSLRGLTVTNDGSGIVKVSGTFDATGYIDIYTQTYFNTVKDHKYYISVPKLPTGVTGYNVIVGGGGLSYKSNNGAFVVNGASTGTAYVLFRIPDKTTGVPANTVFTNYAVYVNVFDITAMFGSVIADYVYTLESGTAGAGIAWLKANGFFNSAYYPYDAVALKSVETFAHPFKDSNGKIIGYFPQNFDLELRGIPKLDASNNLYYDGDEYTPDGTVTRKYGIVDLSTLDWGDSTSTRYVSKPVSGMKPVPSSSDLPNIIAQKYRVVKWSDGLATNPDAIAVSNDNNGKLYLYKDSNTSTPSGYMVFELATPTTESV